MNDKELNVAICVARGWTSSDVPDEWDNGGSSGILVWRSPDGKLHLPSPPDHINGIEALGHMHEAEKLLTPQEHHEYGIELHRFFANSDKNPCYYAVTAKSRLRAEAFARVKGLYKDTP